MTKPVEYTGKPYKRARAIRRKAGYTGQDCDACPALAECCKEYDARLDRLQCRRASYTRSLLDALFPCGLKAFVPEMEVGRHKPRAKPRPRRPLDPRYRLPHPCPICGNRVGAKSVVCRFCSQRARPVLRDRYKAVAWEAIHGDAEAEAELIAAARGADLTSP